MHPETIAGSSRLASVAPFGAGHRVEIVESPTRPSRRSGGIRSGVQCSPATIDHGPPNSSGIPEHSTIQTSSPSGAAYASACLSVSQRWSRGGRGSCRAKSRGHASQSRPGSGTGHVVEEALRRVLSRCLS
jgi:hypothetical protein